MEPKEFYRIFGKIVYKEFKVRIQDVPEAVTNITITKRKFFFLKNKKEEGYGIFFVPNPLYVVVPSIFHGLGHVDYLRMKKENNENNENNEKMNEIAACLYRDELTLAISRIYPNFSSLSSVLEWRENKILDKFHREAQLYAIRFRPKVSLRSLNEKMEFLLNHNSPEELATGLAKIV